MPTGSGKSAIYQVPSLLIDGVTLVASPLIALQEDQVSAIEGSGAGTAVAINSGLRAAERRRGWQAVYSSEGDFVFIAPEQQANDEVVARLSEAWLSLIVVDEAHCVSAWGHDFRPDYRRLADVFRRLGESIPIVALTATASVVERRNESPALGFRAANHVLVARLVHDGAGSGEAVFLQTAQRLDELAVGVLPLGMCGQVRRRTRVVESGQRLLKIGHLKWRAVRATRRGTDKPGPF